MLCELALKHPSVRKGQPFEGGAVSLHAVRLTGRKPKVRIAKRRWSGVRFIGYGWPLRVHGRESLPPNKQFQRSVNSRLRRLLPPAELGRWVSLATFVEGKVRDMTISVDVACWVTR